MLRGHCLGIALLAAAPLAAQPADALEAKVRSLAHPRYAERERAARDLEAAGEPALKALREAAGSTDQELRARATVVADRIERTLRSQRLLTAPRLSLKFDKTPLDQAVSEFAIKTQLRVVLDKSKIKNPTRTVTLDTGEVPYWEAVEAFYAAAGLAEETSTPPGQGSEAPNSARVIRRLQPPGPGPLIRLADGPPAGPVDAGRALRVRPLPADFGQNKYDDIKGEVTFHLDVDPAPGLAVRDIIGIEVRQATAADGRPLAAAYPAPPPVAGFGYEEQLVMRQVMLANGGLTVLDSGPGTSAHAVTLKTDGLRPKKLAELQGVVVAHVVTPNEALVTVPQLLRAGSKQATADGLTVTVTDVTTVGNRVVVQARLVNRTDLNDEVMNLPIQMKGRVRQFIRINRGPTADRLPDFKIHDTAGLPLRGLSAQVTGMTFDGTTMVHDVKLSFEKPATLADDALSLVLMGKRQALVDMPFTLKDVTLP